MDLTGPFPLTGRGNCYIMVLKDALTKWVEIFAIDEKDMVTVQMEYLEQFLSRYGAPQILITDRGTEFKNKVAKQIAKLFGSRHVCITAGNARADGQVENSMRTIKDMLQAHVNKHHTDWDHFLPLVAYAYRNIVNDATGYTPYCMMHGCEMANPDEDHVKSLDVSQFHSTVQRMQEVMAHIWSSVGTRVVKNSEMANIRPVERLQYKPYKEGDFFFLRTVPKRMYKNKNEKRQYKLASKLQYRYTGPYIVTKVVMPVLFDALIHGKTRRVHALAMKPA